VAWVLARANRVVQHLTVLEDAAKAGCQRVLWHLHDAVAMRDPA
jgi:hypothetical protein